MAESKMKRSKRNENKSIDVSQQLEDLARFPQENPNPVMRVDGNSSIMYANAACSMLDFLKCQPGQLLPKRYRQIVTEVLNSGSSHMIDIEGKERTFTLDFVPIPSAGYVNIYGNDITDRKKTEEALREAHDELERRVEQRTTELLLSNARLKEENEERLHTEQSLRLERARLDALLRLSQMTEAPDDELASFVLENGIALTQSKIGFVGFLNEDETIYTLHAVSKDVVKECNVVGEPLQWHIAEAGIWADAIRERRTLFINDYSKPHPSKKGLPPGHPPVSRLMVVPLSDGKRIVAVAGMGNKASDYDESDDQQITLLLHGLWNQVQRRRSREALKEAYDELEQKVEQRTNELARANTILRKEVIERKKAQDAIKEEKDRLVALINSITDEIWFADAQGNFTLQNEAALREFGMDLSGTVNVEEVAKGLEVYYPDGSPRPIEDTPSLRALKGEIIRNSESIVRTPSSGELRHRQVSASPVRDANGNIIGSVSVARDITELKKMEEALRETERDLRRAQEVAQTGSWRLDIQHNELLWSDETYRIFGIPKGTPMTYETFLSCVHPDDREYVDNRWQAALQGERYDIEHRTIGGGEIKWIREKAELEFDEQGILKGGFGTAQDITERKRIEHELLLKDYAIASAVSGIGLTDLEGKFTYANPSLLKMVGYEEEREVLGKEASHFAVDEGQARDALRKTLKKGSWAGELKAIRRDGSVFDVYLATSLVKDTPGTPTHVMASFLDITEQKKAEDIIRAERDRLVALINSTTDEIWFADAQGNFILENEAARREFNMDSISTVNVEKLAKGIEVYHPDGSPRPVEDTPALRALKGEIIRNLEEIIRTPSRGELRHRQLNASPVRDLGGNIIGSVSVVRDITELKKMEERIQELLEERSKQLQYYQTNFALLVNTMAEGAIVVDNQGRVLFGNPAAAAIFDIPRKELLGYHLGIPTSLGITEIKFPVGQQTKIIELNTVEVNWNGKRGHLATLRDITEQKHAAELITTLSHRLVEAQEKERREIGHELHDEVGGALTAVKMALGRAKKKLGEKSESELNKVEDIVGETMDLVSTLSQNMRPDILGDFGLTEALKWHFERYTKQTGIKVHFKQKPAAKKYGEIVETTAYRIIQEALTNVARYAGVKEVTVSVHSDAEKLYIQVEDRGCGFAPQEISEAPGGVSGMQDRAFLAGGELVVDSSPGRGTRVTCELPLGGG
jgi:PAS domain S-box-containing protein